MANDAENQSLKRRQLPARLRNAGKKLRRNLVPRGWSRSRPRPTTTKKKIPSQQHVIMYLDDTDWHHTMPTSLVRPSEMDSYWRENLRNSFEVLSKFCRVMLWICVYAPLASTIMPYLFFILWFVVNEFCETGYINF